MLLINFVEKKQVNTFGNQYYYYENFQNLYDKYGIRTICPYRANDKIELNKEVPEQMKKYHISFIEYKTEQELIDYLKSLGEDMYINTFREQEIIFANKIKKQLGQKVSDNPELFCSKHLQRQIVGAKAPHTVVQSFLLKSNHILTQEDLQHMTYPLIIKPVGGLQSAGVSKAYDFAQTQQAVDSLYNIFDKLDAKGLANKEILIEEYIDGDFFSIDYFVDIEQNIFITKPVYVQLGIDLGVDDFMNTYRLISPWTDSYPYQDKLKDFIHDTVKAAGIRNTFVHHEYKVSSDGRIKTIEINGRIGGFRQEMYMLGYDINELELAFAPKNFDYNISNSVAVFLFYADHEAVLQGLDDELVAKFQSLKSYHRWRAFDNKIGQKVGPTKLGYDKVAVLVLKNNNHSIFAKELEFVQQNYFKILNLS